MAGGFDVLALDVHEPQLRVVLHEGKVKMGEFLHFLLIVIADIAGISKHFCQDGMHFYLHLSTFEYFTACLKGPLMRRHQHNIDIFILKHFPCFLALQFSLFRDAAIDKLLGV
jgi:hypothetical protein